jgi:signal transduction histidine kinase/CheY-like chemotaxis protein
MTHAIEMVETSVQNHILSAAQAAAIFLTPEELDQFHNAEDTEKPEWEVLRSRLEEFARAYRVLYVYYWRDYGDGRIQYIIDNDTDPQTMATPGMFFELEEPVPYILEGNTYASDLGTYTESWDGLISAIAPVYNKDGSVYCAAGVDLSDNIILIQRKNMFILRVVQIAALLLSLAAGGAGMWFYRGKARQSENANIAKSRFLSTMSHEIRTPMNAVIGISELALREDTSPKVRDYIAKIKQAGTSLLSIINDILDLSKIEAGKMEVHPGPYDMASILNDVITIISVRLYEKSIRFKVNIDNSLPGKLLGDELRIRQILINILSNAIKYTREGYIEFSVSGEVQDQDTIVLKFVVADTGIGIKEEDLKKLFKSFARLDPDKNRNVEGTGLGLAITYSFCHLMGGSVSAESVYGKGSTFMVQLPQKILDPRPLVMTVSTDQNAGAAEEAAQFTAPDARVLIVDDISINLMVAEGLLAPYKMRIDSCTSGAEAIKMAEAGDYDLVLMDHLMPGMDGIETTQKIRSSEKIRKDLPIIALTANVIAGMRELFLEKGFDDFLSKPIDISAADKIVRKWIPKEKQIR